MPAGAPLPARRPQSPESLPASETRPPAPTSPKGSSVQLAPAVLTALADAFMEVGVFVAVLVAAFGWLRWRHGTRMIEVLEGHARWAPLVGALLGVSPGCAGAIMVMPLYARGTVSFGTVIAALVATMGDSSWVIMAADPSMAALVHGMLFGTGLVTGYLVDALGIAPAVRRTDPGADRAVGDPTPAPAAGADAAATPAVVPATARIPGSGPLVVAREARGSGLAPGGPVLAGALAVRMPWASAPALFWLLAATGFVVAFPTAFQLVDAQTLTALTGGVDPYLALGVCGTAVAAVLFAHGGGKLADDSADTAAATGPGQPFSAVLRHGAHETSFVIVWVAVAYVAWALVHTLTGFDGTQLPLLGFAGVAVGALIGLIPGCAVQIVFTGLYVTGVVPLSTLMANAASQDGDALLPLLALDRHSALVATCITTVPGLVVGTLLLIVT